MPTRGFATSQRNSKQMNKPERITDSDIMKRLDEKPQRKATKSCLIPEEATMKKQHYDDQIPRRVEFQIALTLHKYEYDREDMPRTWYDRYDYDGFIAAGKLDILKYQALEDEHGRRSLCVWNHQQQHIQGVLLSSPSNCCIRGFENNLSPALERQRQRRRFLVIEAVLDEQWRQEEEGTHCSDRVANASSIHTRFCQLQAIDRARQDALSVIHVDMETEDEEDGWCGKENGDAAPDSRHHSTTSGSIPRDEESNVYTACGGPKKLPWIWWSSSSDCMCYLSAWTSLLSYLTPCRYRARIQPVRRA